MSKSVSSGIFSFAASAILLALITFAVLRFLEMPAGSFLDWLVGIGTFAWLMTVVTVPWNIHFESREVLNEADKSLKKEIDFDDSQLDYVRKLARWSLLGALFLHLLSAAGLYWIAWSSISVVGYYGAGAALLLTLLRPSVRAYEYISRRLYSIRESIRYPDDDIAQVKIELEELKFQLDEVRQLLDSGEENSWLCRQEQKSRHNEQEILAIHGRLQEYLKANEADHERITKETRHAVAQLSEDGKFIDNLVEIIRFIKKV